MKINSKSIVVGGFRWDIIANSITDEVIRKATAYIEKPRSQRNALMDYFGATMKIHGEPVQLIPMGKA